MNSDKALSNAGLELTQKLQMHFPRNIAPDVLRAWNGCPVDFLTARLDEVFGVMPKLQSLLAQLDPVTVPATTEPFVARKHFVVGSREVHISYVGDNFKRWFSDKTEEPASEQSLRHGLLRKSSVDGPIITELGGEGAVETSLAQIWWLMKQQPHGEDGTLLTNGYANIFYVKDQNGGLRAVLVHWHDDGWYVLAHSVEYPDAWRDGLQVFSRNS